MPLTRRTRNREYVITAAQRPRQPNLRRRRPVTSCDFLNGVGLRDSTSLTTVRGEGEERHERNSFVTAAAYQVVVRPAEPDAVPVLDGGDPCDVQGLVEVLRANVRQTQVADHALCLQLGKDPEVLGARVHPALPEVDDVERVHPARRQVALYQRRQLVRRNQHTLDWPDLRRDDEIVRVRPERPTDPVVRRFESLELPRLARQRIARIEAGRVEMVHPELDRSA